jgi:hypothetical protein
MVAEISAVQIHHSDTLAAGMDQLTVADVDAHMRGKTAIFAGVLKEDQVAALQLGSGNDDAAAQLIIAGTADGAAYLFVDIGGKAGAVKTLGSGSTPNIGDTLILQRFGTDIAAQCQRFLGGSGGKGLGFGGTGDAVYIILAVLVPTNLALHNISGHVIAVDAVELVLGAKHLQTGTVLKTADDSGAGICASTHKGHDLTGSCLGLVILCQGLTGGQTEQQAQNQQANDQATQMFGCRHNHFLSGL